MRNGFHARMAQIGAFESSRRDDNLSAKFARGDALLMRSAFPRNVNSKPRPRPLSDSELLHYLVEHQKFVAELDEAVRELSALARVMCLLIVSHERDKRYQ